MKFYVVKGIDVRNIQSEKGVLLFSGDQEGNQLMKKYLQHLADRFFGPDFDLEAIRIYDLKLCPDNIQEKLNALAKIENASDSANGKFNDIPQTAYTDDSVLRHGFCSRQYELKEIMANFWNLVCPEHGENLTISNRN